MNQALKQRLVGAVVLVALAVVFLPAVFNGGRPKQLADLQEVPPMPEVPPLVVAEPTRPEGIPEDSGVPASEMYAMDEKTTTVEKIQSVASAPLAKAKPSLSSKGTPNSWVLQVGGFSDKTKAENLKKQLQTKGYRAFTRTIKKDGKVLVRVMIGPELKQTELARIKTAVDREFKVKSIVMKFES